MPKINKIIVHCSDSSFGSSDDIRNWHKERGWRDIGYHFVIPNGNLGQGLRIDSMDGSIETGRTLDGDNKLFKNEVGAHAYGFNSDSIGVCLIGTDRYTDKQMLSLKLLLSDLMLQFSINKENILGHRELKGVAKTCPTGLDMDKLRREL